MGPAASVKRMGRQYVRWGCFCRLIEEEGSQLENGGGGGHKAEKGVEGIHKVFSHPTLPSSFIFYSNQVFQVGLQFEFIGTCSQN